MKQHSFLGNGSETDNGQHSLNKQEYTAAARERLGRHVLAAADKHTTEERCLLRGP
jgi:hypothetical protein